ncbi:NUDIX domain-containing protein [Halothiobacillus sp. DCM-1]|uniref:NUDIX domain-containing protein n=1 Tax=Halothiobacillus sp. DCM-1 TaxID=3112558 RepID=UPI00324E70A8
MNTQSRPLSAITVAGIIHRAGRFLLVEESIAGQRRFNQPAGHVEPGESLLDAVVREVREETRHPFTPEALLGIYHQNAASGARILRVSVIGSVGAPDDAPLDSGILGVHWLSPEALSTPDYPPRSPFVLQCIQDFLAGERHDLRLLHSLLAPTA